MTKKWGVSQKNLDNLAKAVQHEKNNQKLKDQQKADRAAEKKRGKK